MFALDVYQCFGAVWLENPLDFVQKLVNRELDCCKTLFPCFSLDEDRMGLFGVIDGRPPTSYGE